MSTESPRTPLRCAVRRLPKLALLACLAGGTSLVWAQQQPANASDTSGDLSHSSSIYVQGSWANHGTNAATLGVTLPWGDWKKPLWGGEVRGYWDVYATRLKFDGARDYNHTWMFGLTPTVRWRGNEGYSPWFVEAGIGLTYMTDRYITVEKEFSTSFNFASHLGVGYNFGEHRRHEVQLRVEHVSNAGIKHPNPGENFAQLRYAYHF